MIYARIGAVLYIIWGILHVVAAYKVYLAAQTLDPGMIQGRVLQDAWNLLFFAVAGTAIAIMYNWKNMPLGYWLNLVLVSAGDIGFILFVLIPGYLPLVPGALGPALWIMALLFSTLGLLKRNAN